MLGQLQSADFSPHVHERFRLYVGPVDLQGELTPEGEALEIELLSVTALGQPPAAGEPSPARQPFSLIFREPNGVLLPQRIYLLEHAVLGRLPLFVVPIAASRDGTHYQVIFS
jgi:Domain of unknown function (DUF6916)